MKLILKYILILLSTCIATYFAFIQLGKPLIGIDDANIFFIYARNLANGNGFVYQPGGVRVEGFSSLLWVLICSAGYLVSEKPEILLIIFNLILTSFTVFRFINFVDKKFGKDRFITIEGGIALLLIFTNPVFVSWTILSLMETGIWTFLLVNSLILMIEVIESNKVSSLIFFSSTLFLMIPCRPESLLIAAVMIFLLILGLKINSKKIFPIVLLPVSFYLISIIILYSFRLSYFGFIFPNTYYAKVSPDLLYGISEGIKYFIKYFLSNNVVFIALSGIIYYFYSNFRKNDSADYIRNEISYGLINVVICTVIIIPILWGGDVFVDFRFYQPILPFLFFPLIYLIKKLTIYYNLNEKLTVSGKILILIFFSLYFYTGAQIKYHQRSITSEQQYKIAEENRKYGNDLNEFFKNSKLPRIGTIPAGALAYTYKGTIIDLLGLNNIEMAHSHDSHKGLKSHASFNKEVFYEQSPDFILAGFVSDTLELYRSVDFNNNYDLNKVVLKGILNDDIFKEKYQPALISKDKSVLFAYYRKDYLNTLQNEGFLIKTR